MDVPSSDAKALVEEIVESINDIKNVDVLVCPPFTSIASKKGLNDYPSMMRKAVTAEKLRAARKLLKK